MLEQRAEGDGARARRRRLEEEALEDVLALRAGVHDRAAVAPRLVGRRPEGGLPLERQLPAPDLGLALVGAGHGVYEEANVLGALIGDNLHPRLLLAGDRPAGNTQVERHELARHVRRRVIAGIGAIGRTQRVSLRTLRRCHQAHAWGAPAECAEVDGIARLRVRRAQPALLATAPGEGQHERDHGGQHGNHVLSGSPARRRTEGI